MNEKQFSDRIGNVNDKLIRQAEQIPNYRRGHRRRSIRQLATIAAVIALMVCSFSVGALAFSEKIYVEKNQEIIDISDFGISLILPDEWSGKYGYDILDDGDIKVYSLAAREEETDNGTNLKGSLFWVNPKFCVNAKLWCKIEQKYFKAGAAQAAAAFSTKITALRGDVKGRGVSLRSSRLLTFRLQPVSPACGRQRTPLTVRELRSSPAAFRSTSS